MKQKTKEKKRIQVVFKPISKMNKGVYSKEIFGEKF